MTPLFFFLLDHPVDGPVAKRISDAIMAAGIDTHGPEIRLITRYFHWGGRPELLEELREFTSILNKATRSQFYSVWREIAVWADGVMAIPPSARRGRPPGGSLPTVHVIPDSVRAVLPELLVFVAARPLAQTAWMDIVTCDNSGTVSLLPRRGNGVGASADGHRIPGTHAMRLLGPLAQARFPHLSAEEAVAILRSDPVLGRHPLIGIHPTSKFPLTETHLEPLNTLPGSEQIRLTRGLASPAPTPAYPRAVAAAVPPGTPVTQFGNAILPAFAGWGTPTSSTPPQVLPQTPPQQGIPAPATPVQAWTPASPTPPTPPVAPWAPQAPQQPAPTPQQPAWPPQVQVPAPPARAPEIQPDFWDPNDDDRW